MLQHEATYVGLDVQTDTFYETDTGKLKHRQGNIENVLIHYKREYSGGLQKTEVLLYLKNPSPTTVAQVCDGKQVMAQVKKFRKIFFIENVKFHIDHLEGLGHFVEIEAIDLEGSLGTEVLRHQLNYYKGLLQIADEYVVNDSYVNL